MQKRRRKYTLDQVEEWLAEAKREKITIVELAERYGVSPGVFYKWRKWINYRDSMNNIQHGSRRETSQQSEQINALPLAQKQMHARIQALESAVDNFRDTIVNLEDTESRNRPEMAIWPGN